jgi:hypothetical protein
MKCAGCHREMDVGDQFIQFTASEWAEREGLEPLPELDDVMALCMGSTNGAKLAYCEGCTQKADDGWLLDTVYGDEGGA